MEQHLFTFGGGHPLWNYYAVIEASSPEEAREAMFRAFGTEWSMQYTVKEFAKIKSDGFFRNLEPLPTIFCGVKK